MDAGLRGAQRDQEVPDHPAARRSGSTPPYFHDGRARHPARRSSTTTTRALKLTLTAEQKKDLVEYLKSI